MNTHILVRRTPMMYWWSDVSYWPLMTLGLIITSYHRLGQRQDPRQGGQKISPPSKGGHSNRGGGGHSHWKGVWGCAAVMTPFFQVSRHSLAHQFTLNAPLLCPLFSIFRKVLHFQPCFGQNSSSLDPNFLIFSFPRPPFYQENPLPRPYILKPAWHTPTKKSWVPPPPRAFK